MVWYRFWVVSYFKSGTQDCIIINVRIISKCQSGQNLYLVKVWGNAMAFTYSEDKNEELAHHANQSRTWLLQQSASTWYTNVSTTCYLVGCNRLHSPPSPQKGAPMIRDKMAVLYLESHKTSSLYGKPVCPPCSLSRTVLFSWHTIG